MIYGKADTSGFGTSTPAQSSNLFGSQAGSTIPAQNTFSFGNANATNNTNTNTTTNANQTQAKPSFSFGGANNNVAANNSTSPFSFGGSNSTAQPASGGLFGQTNQAQNSNTNNGGQGLFGQPQNNTTSGFGLNSQAAQTQASAGLFGQNAGQGVGLFGSGMQTAQPGALFGQATTNQVASQGASGLFGNAGNMQNPSNTTGNLFGQSQQMQQQQQQQPVPQTAHAAPPSMAQSIYGQKSSQPQFSWSRSAQNLGQSTMPSFSMPTKTLMQSSRFNPSQTYNGNLTTSVNGQQNMYGPSQPATIQDQLSRLKNAWDPTHPDCMFQAYFYNRVAPETASLYTKPPEHKQAAWDEAVSNRPDNSVVPVLARGFNDLQLRVNAQEQQIHAYRTRIHEIANKLKELNDRHILHADPKIDGAKHRHMELSRRALQLASKVQVLRCRGYALRPEEVQLRARLQSAEQQLRDPSTFGRIDEIWASMTLLRHQQKSAEQEVNARGYISTIDFETGDGLERIQDVLNDHNHGIQYISSILREDLVKVDAQIDKHLASQAGLDKSKNR